MLKVLGLMAGVICIVSAVVGIKMLDMPEKFVALLTMFVVILGICCLAKFFSFTDKKSRNNPNLGAESGYRTPKTFCHLIMLKLNGIINQSFHPIASTFTSII